MATVPGRGFGTAEYAMRLCRAQARMAEADLAGLLVMSEAEVRYFSGFHTLFWQSPTRPWFLFVPAAGKPIAVIPEIGAAPMRRTWIDDVRTWAAPAPGDDGIGLLHDLLSPLARNGARLGVMKGHETGLRMPLADYERLTKGLRGLDIVDATGIVRALRMVKSEAEIEKLAHVCAIGSSTFEAVPDFVREGQPLAETFRAFRRECLAQGADDVPYLVGGADQGGYDDVISPPSSRPLRGGDVLMLDTGATFDGYFCDFDRNWAIGRACDEARRAYDVLWRATEAGIEAARPGATCRDLFLAMREIVEELDTTGGDVGRMGHGLGMQLTEWPSLAAWDETVIEAGMVLAIEPSLSCGKGRMMVHEENILVTSGAPRSLTKRAEPDLPVIRASSVKPIRLIRRVSMTATCRSDRGPSMTTVTHHREEVATPRAFRVDPARPLALLERCPVHAATPMHRLDDLARDMGLAKLVVKDESRRMRLGSFKALGGAFAVAQMIRDAAGVADPMNVSGDAPGVAAGMTFITASAGNHGLSVAAGARIFGARAVIVLPETAPEAFTGRIRATGAEVMAGGSYEECVADAVRLAEERGWLHLSDGSWPGYEARPALVLEGYAVLAEECRATFEQEASWPTHVFLQAGVGGLAAAVAAHVREYWAVQPRIVVVEPEHAPCLQKSIEAGALVPGEGPDSNMGRLDCKNASMIAFDALRRDADVFVTITDAAATETMEILARHGIETTPSGAAGLAGLAGLKGLDLDAQDRVLVIVTEGPERG